MKAWRIEAPWRRRGDVLRSLGAAQGGVKMNRAEEGTKRMARVMTAADMATLAMADVTNQEEAPYFTPYQLALLLWKVQDDQLVKTRSDYDNCRAKTSSGNQSQYAMDTILSQDLSQSYEDVLEMPSGLLDIEDAKLRMQKAEQALNMITDMVDTFVHPEEHPGDEGGGANKMKHFDHGSSSSAHSANIVFHRNLFALKTFFKWAGGYAIFLVLVCVLAGLSTTGLISTDAFQFHHQLESSLIHPPNKFSFENIHNQASFWDWVNGTVVGEVVAGPLHGVNHLVGAVRLRQLRVEGRACDHVNATVCYGHYSPGVENTSSVHGGTWESDSRIHREWGYQDYFPGSGVIVELSGYPDKDHESVAKLANSSWLDESTRIVFLDFSLYNENVFQLMVVHFAVEFPPLGGAIPTQRMIAIRWSPTWRREELVIVVLQGVLTLINIYLFMVEVSDLKETFLHEAGSWQSKVWKYLTGGFNVWDLGNILVFFITVGLYITLQLELSAAFQDGLLERRFYYLDQASRTFLSFNDVVAFYVLICFGKILKYLQLIPLGGPALQAIFHTIADSVIFCFLCFFFLFTLVMSLAFHLAFGRVNLGYETVEASWFSTLQSMFGDLDFSYIANAKPLDGPFMRARMSGFFFTTLMVAGNLIIMNITIAVIGTVYERSVRTYSQNRWEFMLTEYEARHEYDNLPSEKMKRPPDGSSAHDSSGGVFHRIYHQLWGGGDKFCPIDPVEESVVKAWVEDMVEQEEKSKRQLATLMDDVAALSEDVGRMHSQIEKQMAAISADVVSRLDSKLKSDAHKSMSAPPKNKGKNEGRPLNARAAAAGALQGLYARHRSGGGTRRGFEERVRADADLVGRQSPVLARFRKAARDASFSAKLPGQPQSVQSASSEEESVVLPTLPELRVASGPQLSEATSPPSVASSASWSKRQILPSPQTHSIVGLVSDSSESEVTPKNNPKGIVSRRLQRQLPPVSFRKQSSKSTFPPP